MTIKELTRKGLIGLFYSGADFKLVDVLNRELFEKEHIKGAISLPLSEIEEKAGNYFEKHDMIVVYCESFGCQASRKASEKLLSLGFSNIWDYEGGIRDYKEGGYPTEGTQSENSSHNTYSRLDHMNYLERQKKEHFEEGLSDSAGHLSREDLLVKR